MATRPPHILMAGGGTGGHVYPAIAIADAITTLRPEARVVFAGTEDRLEARAVPAAGYALHPITAQGLQRRLTATNLMTPVRMLQGLLQSWRLVGAIEPDVAVGTGGYVAGPVLLAAWLRGRPLLIQEQNAYAGVTNRLLARLAQRIHLAFPEAKEWVPRDRAVVSGNPTRRALREADPNEARAALQLPADGHVVLVMGGSLGSAALNEAVETNLEALLAPRPSGDVYVVWQTGTRYYEAINDRVDDHPRLRLVEYIDRMDRAYAGADHQTKNARSMARSGAARVLPEAELADRFVDAVTALLDDPDARGEMAAAAREMARPEAAETIARDVLCLADHYRTN